MRIAIDPQSPTGAVVEVDVWHRTRRNDPATCIVCGDAVKRRPEHGQGTLHFFHAPGANCPSTIAAGERYDPLRRLPRDPSIAQANRAYFLRNLNGMHDRMKKHLGTVKFSDIVEMCERGNEKDVWSLKGMPQEMLPYVLLTCKDQFPPLGQRTYPVYFVIQAPPAGSLYWNFPAGRARHILFVNAKDPSLFSSDPMDLSPPINHSVEKIRELLK